MASVSTQLNIGKKNELLPNGKKKFSVLIKEDTYKNLINDTLREPKRASRFIANISTAVALNPSLNECDPATILSAGLLAETLNLPLAQSFGRAFLIPFEEKKWNPVSRKRELVRTVCQFQVGYKGFIELALRTAQYKTINAMEVREGEYLGLSEETGEPTFSFIVDDDIRESKKIVGYMASFTTIYGFTKRIYFSNKKMEAHAKQYSNAYKSDVENGTEYSFWTKNFDEMAKKTMIRQLISKWGIMSAELQEAFIKDQAVLSSNGDYNYVDNEPINAEITPAEESIIETVEPKITKPTVKKETVEVKEEKGFTLGDVNDGQTQFDL